MNPEGSLKNQLERLRAHLTYRNSLGESWREEAVYELRAVSGKDSVKSKEFERLFADARAERVNTVLVVALDRLTRSIRDLLWLGERLKELKVELVSLKETVDTSTADGRFFVNLMGSLAELERDRTSERNSLTALARADRGLWNGGQLLGYDVPPDGTKGTLVVNEREAEVVRFAFETYLKVGGILKTRKVLNERGFRTKGYFSRRGKNHLPRLFSYASTSWLLQNLAYCGLKEVNKRRRAQDQESLSEWQRYRVVPGNWPALVDRETFDRVQELLQQNERSRHNRADKSRHVYVLQGLLHCTCGSTLEGRSGTGQRGERHYYYVCRSKTCGRRAPESELLRAVVSRVRKLAGSPRVLKNLVEAANAKLQEEVPGLLERRTVVMQEFEELKAQADHLLGLTLGGSKGAVFVEEKLEELGRRRSGLQATLEELDATVKQIRANAVDDERLLSALRQVPKLFVQLAPFQRKELVRLVVARAVVGDGEVRLEFQGRPAPEASLEKLRAPGGGAPRRSERSNWLRR